MKDGCIACGSLQKLHNHHIIPVYWQGKIRKNIKKKETIRLCSECHRYMDPNVVRIDKGCFQYGRYTQAKANRICRALNENTNYLFKVVILKQDFKTVPSWTMVNIHFLGEKELAQK